MSRRLRTVFAALLTLAALLALAGCSAAAPGSSSDEEYSLMYELFVELPLPSTRTVELDMNHDDGLEELLLTAGDDGTGWRLDVRSAGGGSATRSQSGIEFVSLHLADVNITDEKRELLVCTEAADGTRSTLVMRYDGQSLTDITELAGQSTGVYDGGVLLSRTLELYGGSWAAFVYVDMTEEDGRSVFTERPEWTVEANRYDVSDYAALPRDTLLTTADGEQLLPAGTRMIPLFTDLSTTARIQTEAGLVGSISLDLD